MRRSHEAQPLALAAWRHLEHGFDAAFSAGLNPLRHLGALAFLSFWLLAASGIYLYAVLDTSATGAYRSITDLSLQQPWLGGLLRSLHRYAADAFVVLMAAHLLREWLHGHLHGARRYSWLTGVPPVVLVFVSAIGGFWLHWDRLGQYSAIATAEWIDALPFLAAPLARNFLSVDAVSDRLFSLFVFVHIGVPLLLLFALWFHIQRLTRAGVWPPRPVGLGLLFTLLALAIAAPVVSHAPADLATAPQALRLDWILLFIHPLAEAASPQLAWGLALGFLALLFALPFLPQPARAHVAVVDAANCNGCRRCFADCPFAAVTMVPHPNEKIGKQMALVDADLCTGCGICVGACPSSTPFRSAAELVTGIDMPQAPISDLRTRLQRGIAALNVDRPLVAFGCDRGARVAALAAPDVAALSLTCTGQLPPSFVEYALRDGAAGVLVSACREGGCEFRLGQRWTEERLQGLREPHLRDSVPRERLEIVWADNSDDGRLRRALECLRERVRKLQPAAGPKPKSSHA
jgi:quinol-cytochrome oxidoreductase complex cytochrome b subunit/coenzyme F420-reducing hydrogenase delta subunit